MWARRHTRKVRERKTLIEIVEEVLNSLNTRARLAEKGDTWHCRTAKLSCMRRAIPRNFTVNRDPQKVIYKMRDKNRARTHKSDLYEFH